MSEQKPKTPSTDDVVKNEKAKIELLSKKGDVSVVTDGKRVWKEGPKDSGIGPLKS